MKFIIRTNFTQFSMKGCCNRFRKFIKSIDIWVRWILIISVIVITLCNILPESIIAKASILLKIVENISLSIFSALIFYVIITHRFEKYKVDLLSSYVFGKVNKIVIATESLKSSLLKASSVDLKSSGYTESNIKLACDNISVHDKVQTVIFGNLNDHPTWWQYMQFFKDNNVELINKVITKLPYIDVELVKLLVDLEDSKLFERIDTLSWVQFNPENPPTLHFLSSQIYFYIESSEKLKTYYNDKFKKSC